MKWQTFLGDVLCLSFLVIIDHLRSVPRKSNFKLLHTYWQIYWNTYKPVENRIKKYTRANLLQLYHQMTLVIWKVYWVTPSLYFNNYRINTYNTYDKDGNNKSFPYVHYMRFDCLNHIYFFSFRHIQHENKAQIDRALKSLDDIYNEYYFLNSSLIFITEQEIIENRELNLIEEFPEAIFDTIELKIFKKYHENKSIKLIIENYPIKVYCNTNIPGTIITYWTFNWVFQELINKFRDYRFYIEDSVLNHFDKRMKEEFADPVEMTRWAQFRSSFQTFSLEDHQLEYYPDHKDNNKYKCTEVCLRNQGYYILSMASKTTYNLITKESTVPLPLILFPSKGCLKNSNEDRFEFNTHPFYIRWLKILSHNIKMLIFIYID